MDQIIPFIIARFCVHAQNATVFPRGEEPPVFIQNDFNNGYSEWPHVRYALPHHSSLKNKILSQGLCTEENRSKNRRVEVVIEKR